MRILNKIWNWVFKEGSKDNRTFPLMDNITFPSSLNIILIGFSYDKSTAQTFSWINNILSKSPKQHRIFRFRDLSFRKVDLTNLLKRKSKRIEIFCGHGSSDGLYGPPYNSIAQGMLKPLHSNIYDVHMITSGPSSMFAFCCGAASKFGRVFASEKGNSFIGFRGDLPFPEELYDDLKYIFQTVTQEIIRNGHIENKHERLFIDGIDMLIENSHKYKNPILAEMYLMEYKNHFIAYV